MSDAQATALRDQAIRNGSISSVQGAAQNAVDENKRQAAEEEHHAEMRAEARARAEVEWDRASSEKKAANFQKATQADMTQAEKLAAYQQTATYKNYQASMQAWGQEKKNEAKAAQADMTQAEKLAVYQQTDQYKNNQASLQAYEQQKANEDFRKGEHAPETATVITQPESWVEKALTQQAFSSPLFKLAQKNETLAHTLVSIYTPIADSLQSIADPNRNPRMAAARQQLFDGAQAWRGIFTMRNDTVKYTTDALKDRRWQDVWHGTQALFKQNLEVAKYTAVATGMAAWGFVTTPVRIFTHDIPEFYNAGKERMEGKDRFWDVLFTGTNLAGDVSATYGMAQPIGLVDRANAQFSKTLFGQPVPNELVPYYLRDTFLNGSANRSLLDNLVNNRLTMPSAKMTTALNFQDAVQSFPKLGLYPAGSPLRLAPGELLNDNAAQQALFDIAKNMRDAQQSFAQDLLDRLGIDGKFSSILKRDTLEEFVDGIVTKCQRNSYDFIGQMDDMTRGRFNLNSWNDVETVHQALENQTEYEVANNLGPRRVQPDGSFGYPRFHIVVRDPETLMTHEWQIGTDATSRLFEQPGIKIPDALELKPGMHNDLHDIEYDIFKQIQDKHPDVAQQYGIPEFRAQLDKYAGETGKLGQQLPNLEAKIYEMHAGASDILEKLVGDMGADYIKQFFH